ncbi:NAD-dependent succinate-semialdehyde dehydrogenase [Inquilinus sp. CAU 1745]|uniref:NAD-dependent succinate-semialdehyde dehydrogenase n=1 Tax=Inquilinus sp. CAU 1745 TaxID=3140369 RepID=UPI00325B4F75
MLAEVARTTGPLSVENRLSRPDLFRQSAFLAGEWVDGPKDAAVAVTDPATGATIGHVPGLGAPETERAIAAAAEAYGPWRRLLAKERAAILRRWGDLMLAHKEDLAVLMTLEQGKPIDESRGEIDYAASFLEWFGEEAKRLYGDTIPSHLSGSRMSVTREPVGVTAAITPWNFPSAMITRKAGAALAAGCPMIVRPASETPFSALALAVLAVEAGVPEGVFSVLTGPARAIAGTLTASPVVRKISFTGSTEVGRILLAQSAETVKKVSMELGGHAPFLAFDDSDLEAAVAGAVAAKFATTGQDCLAVNRLYVQDGIHDAFVARFADAVAALKVGPGLDPSVDQGPLMSESAVAKCEAHVADALAKGAKAIVGGKRHELGGTFFQPTVLTAVTEDMAIANEETFGPVAPILRFTDEAEGIARANDTVYGLAAYAYSRDVARVLRVSEALEYGMVGINTPKFTGAPIPFGGVKQSGLGREGSRHGLDDYTELKYVCIGGVN